MQEEGFFFVPSVRSEYFCPPALWLYSHLWKYVGLAEKNERFPFNILTCIAVFQPGKNMFSFSNVSEDNAHV